MTTTAPDTGRLCLMPISVTCDWGDCDDMAIGFRNEVEDQGWLPVCGTHYDAEPDKSLVAKFISESVHAELERERDALKLAIQTTIANFDRQRLERCTYCRKGYEWDERQRQHVFHCASPKFDGQLLPCIADDLRIGADRLRAALGETK
jgi:hypothetical protein